MDLPSGPEDLAARIHREIGTGSYECMICYSGVSRRSKIWYCRCCWSVYHLHCVQKWAKQGLDQEPTRPIGVDGPKKAWRCPACNNSSDEIPSIHTCWCEKTIQPEISKYVPPHSCGQTCGKQRASPRKCPHACNLQCHAGPCPPCTALGPPQPCYCAKEESQRRCVDTDYEHGWSCGQVCGDFMPCGEHECPSPCHPGLCGQCEHEDLLKCYCGSAEKNIKCCEQEESLKSVEPVEQTLAGEDENPKEWFGFFTCGKVCKRLYDCNIHHCEKICHPQDFDEPRCPLSPDLITHCLCGKTQLSEILPKPRENCEAPIPSCEKIHGKRLPCGHECPKKCHDGECGPCLKTIKVTCRCGKTLSTSLCHQGEDIEPPQCTRNCRVALNCGRHECGEKCCSGEQKAQERLSVKKKMRVFSATASGLQTDSGFEPEHICTRPCGRLLKCEQHTCPMLCHRGPCGTCLEASFEELTCNCGRTSVQPPVPCGSKPPVCHYDCTREPTCGHPVVRHACHMDDDSCPKCPYLVEKLCTCGKKTVKSVSCFREIVSCGTVCGKKLTCGSHGCPKICHDGPCETPCKQECGKPKSICGHPCTNTCHAPFQCAENKPCTAKVQLQCSCGGIKQDIKCGSTKSNPTGNKKELKCTDQCRGRRLAMALKIDPEREGEPLYSNDTIISYNRDKRWSTQIEQRFRSFAENAEQKRLQFQPMRQILRTFLHQLAEDFGLESESQDPEPYRSVVIRKGPSFTMAPRKSVAEYLSSRPSSVGSPLAVQQLKKQRGQAVNAFVLQGIRVGLLAAELEKELSSTLDESHLRFSIGWHGDEDVLLSPKASSLDMDQIEAELRNICPQLKRIVASKGLSEAVELCWVGQDGRIANKETERWSVVNNKKAGIAAAPSSASLASRNRFDMTMPQVAKESTKKKKLVEEPMEVVDDWEMEAEADETEITTEITTGAITADDVVSEATAG
ncbi:hypothetical protein EDC01DRAFT_717194 [Geopyxis carbonaria]|nr:hypothetical protein EDC01DRAFT_717194 [Geopyxis carbonaria]